MHVSVFDPRVIILIISTFISLFLIVFCFMKGKKSKLLYSYILLHMIAGVWSFFRIPELLAHDPKEAWLAIVFQYLAICYVGFSWLLFCGLYSQNRVIIKKRNIFLLLISPTLSYSLLLSNQYYHLFFRNPTLTSKEVILGLGFWFHTITTYIYILIGIIIMVKYAIQQFKEMRTQSILLIISAVIPFMASIINILMIITEVKFFDAGMDMTPIGLSISLLLYGIVLNTAF